MAKKRQHSRPSSLVAAVEHVIHASSTGLVCMLLAGPAPQAEMPAEQMEKQSWNFRQNLHQERLGAIRRIIKRRSAVAGAMEQHSIDSSSLFELDLFTNWSDEVAARERTVTLERVYIAACRLRAVLATKSKSRTSAEPSPTLLTELQQSIWNCLEGKALLSKEIRKLLPSLPSDEAVRKHVQAIRGRGHDIQYVPQQGYVRPDAPPQNRS